MRYENMALLAHTQCGQAGSIGPRDPAPATCNRIKGFHPDVLTDRSSVDRFLDRVHTAQDAHPTATRTSVRAFIERGMRRKMGPRVNGLRVEGIVPVDHIAPGVDMVYLGANKEGRIPNRTVFESMVRENHRQTTATRPKTQDVNAKIAANGYGIEKLTLETASPTDLDVLVKLYREAFPVYIFEITTQTLKDLLREPGNIFLVARSNSGAIVSSMIAEYSSLDVGGTPVDLYELSDFATDRAHQGRQLMVSLQIRALSMIEEIGNPSIIYAEDRGPLPAVVRSSHFAGLSLVGALPAHVTISGQGHENYASIQSHPLRGQKSKDLLPLIGQPCYLPKPFL